MWMWQQLRSSMRQCHFRKQVPSFLMTLWKKESKSRLKQSWTSFYNQRTFENGVYSQLRNWASTQSGQLLRFWPWWRPFRLTCDFLVSSSSTLRHCILVFLWCLMNVPKSLTTVTVNIRKRKQRISKPGLSLCTGPSGRVLFEFDEELRNVPYDNVAIPHTEVCLCKNNQGETFVEFGSRSTILIHRFAVPVCSLLKLHLPGSRSDTHTCIFL